MRGKEGVHESQASPTWSSLSGDENRVSVPTEILRYEEDFEGQSSVSSASLNREEYQVPAPSVGPCHEQLQHSLNIINRRLEVRRGINRQGGRSSSTCIFPFPHGFDKINPSTYQPELVSIGPYHRGKDHVLEFEECKWFFLDRLLSRSKTDLIKYLGALKEYERSIKASYSETVSMSSHDFVEMMLLDSCFVLELLRNLNHSEGMIDEDDPIFTRPSLIPILIRDLLKCENQLPYFLLHLVFNLCGGDIKQKPDPLPILALKSFDLVFPRRAEILNEFRSWHGKHLLELFHSSLLPTDQVTICIDLEEYRPSDQSIQCVTQLRPSGIKFRPRKCDSFLDINFRNCVLEIPSVTITDITSTVLVNCVALEHYDEKKSKYFTDYVSFMNCLIDQPRDVTFLCSEGIITRFSQDDQYVADLFNTLGKNVAFNIRECYLSKVFTGVESYYRSSWATMRRTYFSSPWSFISVLSAAVLLGLTMDMESRATRVEEFEMKANASTLRRKGTSLLNGESSSQMRGEEGVHESQASPTWSSLSGDENRVSVPTEIVRYEEHFEGQSSLSSASLSREKYQVPAPSESPCHEQLQHSLNIITRRLEERRGINRQGGRSSSTCIFPFPRSFDKINPSTYQPELVSIGPYHRGKDHVLEFEECKWFFLERLLSRSKTDLIKYLGALKEYERSIKASYSETVSMSSHDFVEMMLLDSCFVLELLRNLNHSEGMIDEDDPIFTRPWLIPILIRDLLKCENQLPYFLLLLVFNLSGCNRDIKQKPDPLPILALKSFDLVFPRRAEILNKFRSWNGKHLLDLFHSSLLPTDQVTICTNSEEYRPSDQSIQCVTQLRPSGIKFRPRKCDSFLDINFRNCVLEIPSVTINDFTSTVLVNCVALEHYDERKSKYFTEYVSFMNCLIDQPRDVTFLCSEGIITRFSQGDQYVADLFNTLGKNVAFNIRECYLSKVFTEVESCYSSNWATWRRTYFSSPWSFISVLSAAVLLGLTMVQSIMSVLSYMNH
ncbi:hypothetical protein SADUNF_Sadunf04G0132200 [Salix dunnii]|uniref:Uncharacterized protein n=1 Tax=Salix dunnii TaxID=1413687 RepID=A0A835N134_9ROSI|nr:hypothetical protein SADUNF_Sadunf04G0132200 [Salix dunnii]